MWSHLTTTYCLRNFMAYTMLNLNTGASIPALGLGTRQSPAREVKEAFAHALSVGYRHIDCAYVYGNEDEVGEALKETPASGTINRNDIFVTSRLWCTYHSRVEKNLRMSLKSFGLDYVDLYLMHWPWYLRRSGMTNRQS